MADDAYITPATAFQAVAIPHPALERAELRRRMVAAVEKMLTAVDLLIAELDTGTPDADLEPCNGSLEVHNLRAGLGLDQRNWAIGGDEGEREPPEDAEPSLAFNEVVNQSTGRLFAGGDHDLEDEHDGREPGDDDFLRAVTAEHRAGVRRVASDNRQSGEPA